MRRANWRSHKRRRRALAASGTTATGVRSPIDGVVAEVLAASGAWVSGGQPVVRVIDPRRLWLDVSVPEAYVGRISSLSGAWFTFGEADDVVEIPRTDLVSVGMELDPTTRTLPVRFTLDNAERRFVAGLTVQVRLVTATPTPRAAVPMRAVVDDAGVDVVYVQTGGETFVRRPVQLGARDGAYVAVSGVEPGEWIATTGAYSVKLASTSTESVGHGHAH